MEPSTLTVGEYLRQWLRDYAETHVRQRTLEGYRERLEKHVIPHVGHIALDKLSPRQIQGMETTLLKSGRRDGAGGLSAQTVLNVHRVLFQALRHALRLGLLQRNPAEAVEPPRASRYQARTMDWDDVQQFLEAARESPHYPLFILALHTGLRRSDLLGLRWKDVSLENDTIAVTQAVVRVSQNRGMVSSPKSGRARVVTLPQESILVLQHHREQQEARAVEGQVLRPQPGGFVFSRADGSSLSPEAVSKAFRKAVGKAGLKGVRFHDLRHTHASLLLSEGVHLKVVSERLGHAGVGITGDLYSHVMPNLQRDAAERFGASWSKRMANAWIKLVETP